MKIANTWMLAVMLAGTGAAAEQNPLARLSALSAGDVNGRWNGVNLERRTGCANPQNDGSRGTYAQFDIVADAAGNFGITQSGITGLNCSYSGRYEARGAQWTVQGSYGCTDGKQGTFASGEATLHAPSLDFRLAIRLTAGESCTIDSILSLARFPG